MDKTNTYYEKALNYYHKGYIDRAIELCERNISENIKNRAAIDLKGLLYYLKGDIKNCKTLWKLNLQLNDDKVAKKYLEGLEKDEKRLKVYVKAIKEINSMRINEALELLLECDNSDFNTINVNNYLCICYIKQGDFEKAREKLEKVISLDKNNSMALENKRILVKYEEFKNKVFNKKYFYGLAIITICLAIVFIVNLNTKLFNMSFLESKKSIPLSNNKTNEKVSNKSLQINSAKGKNENSENIQFPYDKFKKAVDNKDFENLYIYVEQWKNSDLRLNYKEMLSHGEKLLKEEGIGYFYRQGTLAFDNKDYSKAINEFLRAFNYGKDNYLYPHVIYFIGESYKNIGDYENAVKFYTMYDEKFYKGDYKDIVLYNMAMISKNIDINKAKEYAKRLSREYSQSIYNNSNIKDILKN
ncbi:tetratricopeptide repeat protein [Clostridium pasteurianum]|uniref:tetratricopeptide repeat protein n=1 Tax=Clostridium pasteurianum TaxID=1501 RepID=UPI0022608C2E|nr:tetratricopeptide repeat protein [Clostridium pasteurianum]UZW13939.1 tetratricopeptide repeat protein [Clostridium pasteurianum]